MSSISYANVAAGSSATGMTTTTSNGSLNGSHSPASEALSQDFKIDQTTANAEEVDDSSATTEEDFAEANSNISEERPKAPSASTESTSKKEKVKQNLAPAPVPKVSPWAKKSSSPAAPTSTSNVNEKHWPTPDVLVAEQVAPETRSKNVAPTVKSTGKEKWVPFQASVVMSGPKSSKPNNNNAGSQKKSNKAKKGSKQQQQNDQQQKQNGARRNHKQAQNGKGEHAIEKKTEEKIEGKFENGKVEEAVTASVPSSASESPVLNKEDSEKSKEPTPQPASKQASEDQEAHHNQHQHRQNRSFSQEDALQQQRFEPQEFKPYTPNHSRQQSNGGSRRYNNRPQHGFVPFNRNVNFIPTTYLPNGQVFQPRSFNQGFIPQNGPQPIRFNNGFAPVNNFGNPYPNIIPFPPVNTAVHQINQINAQDPVTSLAFQVDYYFSVQNLVKDIFLRKQMDSEGYIPLKVIANFYRVQHLSGGDLKLVLDALDSCGNLEYVGNKETFDIKLRAKENPLNWVLPVEQRD